MNVRTLAGVQAQADKAVDLTEYTVKSFLPGGRTYTQTRLGLKAANDLVNEELSEGIKRVELSREINGRIVRSTYIA